MPRTPSVAASVIEARNREALDAHWGRRFPREATQAVRQQAHGPEAVEIAGTDGRWVAVSEPGDPREAASRWLDAALGGGTLPATVCVIGAALGHVLDVIAERSASTRMLVLEPEPGLVPLLLARRDWRPLITAGRLLVLAGPDYAGAALAWKLLDGESAPLTLIHPRIGRERRDAAKAAARVIARGIVDWTSNREARRVLGAQYLRNTLANLPAFDRAGDVADVADLCRGVPAIVAGAGPSLNRNLAELAALGDLRERAVFIATDTALRPCVAAGVRPEFAVAVDASDANARHLIDLPEGLDTWLVAEASVAPHALHGFDRLLLWRVGEHEPWPLLREAGVSRGVLRVWGSVLTAAADLALRLGCDPIVFIGADLAYTNGQPYCRGTVYDADWAREEAQGLALDEVWRRRWMKEPAVQEIGVEGAATRTATHFTAFRDWLVDLSTERRDRRFVNATGAGILQGGAFAQMRPADALGAGASCRVDRRAWSFPSTSSAPSRLVERRLCAGVAAPARVEALSTEALMTAVDHGELTRLEAEPTTAEGRRTLAAVSSLIERAGEDPAALLTVAEQLTVTQPWREWPLLERVRVVNRVCQACVTGDGPAGPSYDALVPVFQASLQPALHPGYAASMYDQLHDLCWRHRRGGRDLRRFTDEIVEPMRGHSRAWADAVGLRPRRFGDRGRLRIAYLGYNSRLAHDHPAARAVRALLQGHRRLASDGVDVSYVAWRACDVQWRRALDELGVPMYEQDWPSAPCGAIAALRGLLDDLHVDALVTDQNLGVPTVLFEARSAPIQLFLDMGFPVWSPHLIDGALPASGAVDLAAQLETLVANLAHASR
jgi:hypothetical protein